MDGIHDLGGKHGFGKVQTEADEVAFPERWQGAVFTMVNSLFFSGVAHNADHFRHAIERIDPVSYLNDGYYGRWLGGLETLLVEADRVSQADINERAITLGAAADGRIAARPNPQPDVFPAEAAAANAQASEDMPPSAHRDVEQAPRFAVDETVRTITTSVPGHTRLPAYARGAPGKIVAWHGAWVYPDSNAHGQGEQPQHLYTVAFSGADLWGSGGDSGLEVCLDLFEPYLLKG